MQRRTFLTSTLAGLGLAFLPGRAARAAAGSQRLVFVMLRGGADALSLLAPAGAAAATLAQWRPTLALTGGISLSPDLQAHSALAPLVTSASLANLTFVLHAGGASDTRSHFDQQHRIETGDTGGAATRGFLASVALAANLRTCAVHRTAPRSLSGANPIVLSDPARLTAGYSDTGIKPGWSRAQRLAMYQTAAGEVGNAKADALSRQALADGNALASELGTETLATLTSRHGYVATSGFAGRLALAARLAATTLAPRLLTVEGDQPWDTHTSQNTNNPGAATGLSASLKDLATNLAAFRTDLISRGLWSSTVVVVMSEFGRTVKENASAGTDHGRGGLMIVMGGPVRAFGDAGYRGLARWQLPSDVDGSTPLALVHDYRVVMAEILERHLLLPAATVQAAFLAQLGPTSSYLNVLT
jgi:uncharacterized protein (DUF1501 family)